MLMDPQTLSPLFEGEELLSASLAVPKNGLLSDLGNELSKETHADKAKTLLGRSTQEQQSKGTQENCSTTWLTVSNLW